MTRLPAAIAMLLLMSHPGLVQAQEPPELVTDRPDFTESSEVVERGAVQIETGFTLESNRSQDEELRGITVPAVLARIGLVHRVELRFGGDGYLRAWTTGPSSSSVSGYSDVEVGAKVKLWDGAAFDIAAIPILSIPTNDEDYSSGTYDAAVKLTWAADLPRSVGLSGNVNVARRGVESDRFSQGAVSVSLGHPLGGAWGAYWEGYAFTPTPYEPDAAWTVNGGATRALGPNMQFDVEVGRGVTRAAVDWFVGVGFVVRRNPSSPRAGGILRPD